MSGTLTTNVTQTLQTTSSLMQQVGTQLNNSVTNVPLNLGSFVQNISILPFIPAATIRFDAVGMKPNTRLYAYFNNVPVSQYCAMLLNPATFDPSSVSGAQQTQALGTPLITDSTGKVSGVFSLPTGTFQSQQITFELNDISDLSQGADAITTQADGVYYGSTLSVAQGQSLLNTRQTVLSSTEVTQQQTVQGLAVNTQTTQQYIPDPPPSHGGSGCGCGSCFIGETKVLLASGSLIAIKDIKVGDKVYNWNKTEINTVKYVESINSSKFIDYFYSPTSDAPFATLNHPMYINGVLSSVDPDQNDQWYPWLGKTNKVDSYKVKKYENEVVYNLWVDGDNTFTVNGLGTTSIIGDGGLLRNAYEQGFITDEQIVDFMIYYTTASKEISYGSYFFNNLMGKLNIRWINKILAYTMTKEGIFKTSMNKIFKLTGSMILLFKTPHIDTYKQTGDNLI